MNRDMAAADTDIVKRPRLDSWSGSSQRVEPPSNPAGSTYPQYQYTAPHAPQGPPSPTAYQQESHSTADPRGGELPSPSHPFHPPAGYVTPSNGLSGPGQAPPEPIPPNQAPIKARPLNDQQPLHQLRPLTISTSSSGPSNILQQTHIDHPSGGNPGGPISEQHHAGGVDGNMSAIHHGLQYPQQHDGGYGGQSTVGTPISAGPGHSIMMGGGLGSGQLMGGGGTFIHTTTYPPRRKAIRAAQACDACRQRKAKCDEGRPSCGFCKEAGLACVYREVPPPKQDRTLLQILDRLTRIEERLGPGPGRDDGSRPSSGNAPSGPLHGDNVHLPQAMPDINAPQVVSAMPALRRASTSDMADRMQTSFQSEVPQDDLDMDSEPPGELSIPMEHTTAAHKLLRWPSIKNFVGKVTDNEDYVMEAEERRGLLRVYGRGEGHGSETGSSLGGGSDAGSPEADDGAHTPLGEPLWGTGLTIGDNVEIHRKDSQRVGGLNPDGSLQLETTRVHHLLNSYFQNIHIMHPFLDKNAITSSAIAFSMKHTTANGVGGVPPNPPFVSNSGSAPIPGKAPKRKRSTTTLLGPNIIGSGGASRVPIERSIETALILLVLALGKISEHRTWLPGPVPENKKPSPRFPMSPPLRTDSPPISVKHSPTSSASSSYSALSSPYDSSRMPNLSRRGSVEGHPAFERRGFEPRNVDVIPGLAYYALATEILGTLMGGNDLPHVQAGLLAGLYCGQLGRVLESWRWINWACTGCQILLRKDRLKSEQNASRRDRMICAFWTCLQLESDVLAELDLPPSGISRFEPTVGLPSGDQPDTIMWMYYLAQISLRKILNRVHTELYKENKDSKHAGWSTESATELDSQLNQWRRVLPPQIRWLEDEPPSSDINAARLRAKYYGARYIIHRPFVHHALHPIVPHGTYPSLPGVSPNPRPARVSHHTSPTNHAALRAQPGSSQVKQRQGSATMAPPDPVGMVDRSVIEACRNCIYAAVQSTKAFHGIAGRPIVTNIFGTAHAQFGNLLVLQAAYRSPILHSIVSAQDLKYLMEETIQFFRHLAPISPTLQTDAIILESSMRTLKLDQTPPTPAAVPYQSYGDMNNRGYRT